MQRQLQCDHHGTWKSHPPLPIGVQGGALVVTVMYCIECGYVEYRSPPIKMEDEEALDERAKKVQNVKRILEPIERKNR